MGLYLWTTSIFGQLSVEKSLKYQSTLDLMTQRLETLEDIMTNCLPSETWDSWVERLPFRYNVSATVAVDEMLFPFHGRCPFRWYIPSKPDRYWIKAWAACDSETSYLWNAEVYLRWREGERPEQEQGKRVVLQLTEGLKEETSHATTFSAAYSWIKNWLCTRKLLLEQSGRIRRNFLQNLWKKKRVFSTLIRHHNENILISYCLKKGKTVVLLTSMHDSVTYS